MIDFRRPSILTNIDIVFDAYDLPRLEFIAASEDRAVFWSTVDFMLDLADLVNGGEFAPWDLIVGHTGGVRGWRECVATYSLQIVDRVQTLEVDIDYWSPERGLGPMLLHGFECLWNWITGAKTNQERVYRTLIKRHRKERKQRYVFINERSSYE